METRGTRQREGDSGTPLLSQLNQLPDEAIADLGMSDDVEEEKDNITARAQIGPRELKNLQKEFDSKDGGFTEQEFVERAHKILKGTISIHELTELFLKVDANSDGTVDWEEFSSFMFLNDNRHVKADYVPRLFTKARAKRTDAVPVGEEITAPTVGSGSEEGAIVTQKALSLLATYRELGFDIPQDRSVQQAQSQTANSSSVSHPNLAKGHDESHLIAAHQESLLRTGKGIREGALMSRSEEMEGPRLMVSTGKGGSIPLERAIATSLTVAKEGVPVDGTIVRTEKTGQRSEPKGPHAQAHNELVTQIIYVPGVNRYFTASKDGLICVWDLSGNQCSLRQSFKAGCRLLTSMIYLPNCNRLAVGSVEHCISFYEFSSVSTSVKLVARIPSHRLDSGVPISMHSYMEPETNVEVLLVGDDIGNVHRFRFLKHEWEIGSLDKGYGASSNRRRRVVKKKASDELVNEVFEGVEHFKSSCHEDWVTHVDYIKEVNFLISSSSDGTLKVWDVEHMELVSCYKRNQPILHFAWSEAMHVLGFCGGDRTVTLWNPFSTRKLAGLYGHSSVVVQIAFDDKNLQLISLAKDRSFRVWDVRSMKCVQIFKDEKHVIMSQQWLPRMHFNREGSFLATATRSLSLWPLRALPGTEGGVKARKGIVRALYNRTFREIVTVEKGSSSVYVWNAENGALESQFHGAHGGEPITALTFDREQRRLITGSLDGKALQVWNFNNGQLLKEFIRNPHHRDRHSKPALPKSPRTSDIDISAASTIQQAPNDTHNITVQGHHGSTFPATTTPQGKPTSRSPRSSPRFGTASGRSIRKATTGTPRSPRSLEYSKSETLHSASEASVRASQKLPRALKRMPTEICSVICIDRVTSPPRGTGKPSVQKFVAAVGFDGTLQVFEDNLEDSGEIEPIFTLPLPADEAVGNCHKGVIKSVAFVPPNHLATGGQDGTIRIWSLNDGKHEKLLYQPFVPDLSPLEQLVYETPSINSLIYCQRIDLLVAVGDSQLFRTFSIKNPGIEQAYMGFSHRDASFTSVVSDTWNEQLLTGDDSGYVQLWDILTPRHGLKSLWHDKLNTHSQTGGRGKSQVNIKSRATAIQAELHALTPTTAASSSFAVPARESLPGEGGIGLSSNYAALRPLARWKAHDKVTSVQFVESITWMDIYVLTAGNDGTTSLWTCAGQPIGVLGQATPYDLQAITSPSADEPLKSYSRFIAPQFASLACIFDSKGLADGVVKGMLQGDRGEGYEVVERNLSFIEVTRQEMERRNQELYSRGSSEDPTSVMKGSTAHSKMPAPGQVWIRLQRAGGVQERRNDDLYTLPDPYESEDWMQQYLPHLKALITVQRVTKDSVIAWDGLASGSPLVFISLVEFTAPSVDNSAPWMMAPSLTARIGRIFRVTLDEGKVRQKRQLERKKKRDEEQRLRDEEQQQLQAKMMEGQSKEQDKFKVVFLPSQDLNREAVERERRKRAELAKRKEEEALLREEQEAEAMPLSTWDLLSEPFKVLYVYLADAPVEEGGGSRPRAPQRRFSMQGVGPESPARLLHNLRSVKFFVRDVKEQTFYMPRLITEEQEEENFHLQLAQPLILRRGLTCFTHEEALRSAIDFCVWSLPGDHSHQSRRRPKLHSLNLSSDPADHDDAEATKAAKGSPKDGQDKATQPSDSANAGKGSKGLTGVSKFRSLARTLLPTSYNPKIDDFEYRVFGGNGARDGNTRFEGFTMGFHSPHVPLRLQFKVKVEETQQPQPASATTSPPRQPKSPSSPGKQPSTSNVTKSSSGTMDWGSPIAPKKPSNPKDSQNDGNPRDIFAATRTRSLRDVEKETPKTSSSTIAQRRNTIAVPTLHLLDPHEGNLNDSNLEEAADNAPPAQPSPQRAQTQRVNNLWQPGNTPRNHSPPRTPEFKPSSGGRHIAGRVNKPIAAEEDMSSPLQLGIGRFAKDLDIVAKRPRSPLSPAKPPSATARELTTPYSPIARASSAGRQGTPSSIPRAPNSRGKMIRSRPGHGGRVIREIVPVSITGTPTQDEDHPNQPPSPSHTPATFTPESPRSPRTHRVAFTPSYAESDKGSMFHTPSPRKQLQRGPSMSFTNHDSFNIRSGERILHGLPEELLKKLGITKPLSPSSTSPENEADDRQASVRLPQLTSPPSSAHSRRNSGQNAAAAAGGPSYVTVRARLGFEPSQPLGRPDMADPSLSSDARLRKEFQKVMGMEQDPRTVHRITDVPRDVEDVLYSSQASPLPDYLVVKKKKQYYAPVPGSSREYIATIR